MKPIIGIIMRPGVSKSGYKTMYAYGQISHIIVEKGGIPLGIISPTNFNYYNKKTDDTPKLSKREELDLYYIIDKCDGLIFQGGDDYYDYDLKAIKYAYIKNIPSLGICLGMQAMAMAFNGIMKDTSNHYKSKDMYAHQVKINASSKLYSVLRKDVINVNSRHRSMITSTDLNIVGLSDDGVIEAIEDSTKDFFIGLQWHPETMVEYDILASNLFAYFITKCEGYNDNKKTH
jgi:gamma-glutamyl-gamma-aminobutyrate hydrolase PuuD